MPQKLDRWASLSKNFDTLMHIIWSITFSHRPSSIDHKPVWTQNCETQDCPKQDSRIRDGWSFLFSLSSLEYLQHLIEKAFSLSNFHSRFIRQWYTRTPISFDIPLALRNIFLIISTYAILVLVKQLQPAIDKPMSSLSRRKSYFA